MKYLAIILLALFSVSGFSQSTLDKINELSKKIDSIKELTLEEQYELDNQIMELQFVDINEFFEKMRSNLAAKAIIEPVKEETGRPRKK